VPIGTLRVFGYRCQTGHDGKKGEIGDRELFRAAQDYRKQSRSLRNDFDYEMKEMRLSWY